MDSSIPGTLDTARLADCLRTLGATGDLDLSPLAARYAEPHRAYHTAEHIAECLAWLDRARDAAERPAELEAAIYFHDAVYDPRAHDNEARSAELFRDLATSARIPSETVERVAALIESTARHASDHGDAALLSDIDLSILGAPPLRYARFERDVRREYAMYDDASYRQGRAHVLRSFLEGIQLYRTPRFARLEATARENLTGALAALRADE
jgi:predicted metal-dependent HD superfamily phosphohydrolase